MRHEKTIVLVLAAVAVATLLLLTSCATANSKSSNLPPPVPTDLAAQNPEWVKQYSIVDEVGGYGNGSAEFVLGPGQLPVMQVCMASSAMEFEGCLRYSMQELGVMMNRFVKKHGKPKPAI